MPRLISEENLLDMYNLAFSILSLFSLAALIAYAEFIAEICARLLSAISFPITVFPPLASLANT